MVVSVPISRHAGRCRRLQAGATELRKPGSVPVDDPGHPGFAAMISAVFGSHMECRDCRC